MWLLRPMFLLPLVALWVYTTALGVKEINENTEIFPDAMGIGDVNFTAEADTYWPVFSYYMPFDSRADLAKTFRSLIQLLLYGDNLRAKKANKPQKTFAEYLNETIIPEMQQCWTNCSLENNMTETNETNPKCHIDTAYRRQQFDGFLSYSNCATARRGNYTGHSCYMFTTARRFMCLKTVGSMTKWGLVEPYATVWTFIRGQRQHSQFLDSRAPLRILFSLVFASMATVVGLIGNILVILVALTSVQFRSVTSMYLANQAVADCVFILCNCYLGIYRNVLALGTGPEYFGLHPFFCGLIPHIRQICYISSIFNLIAIGFERFVVITFPMKARSLCTRSKAKKIIVINWILGLLLGVLEYFKWTVDNSFPIPTCAETNEPRYNWLLDGYIDIEMMFEVKRNIVLCECLVLFIIPGAILVFMYGSVAIALIKSIAIAESMSGAESEGDQKGGESKTTMRKESLNERIMLVRLMIAVVTCFILMQGPLKIYWFIRDYFWEASTGVWPINYELAALLLVIFQVLSYVQPAVNPLLYTFTSRQFRRGAMLFLARCFHINVAGKDEDSFATHSKYSQYNKNGKIQESSVSGNTSVTR